MEVFGSLTVIMTGKSLLGSTEEFASVAPSVFTFPSPQVPLMISSVHKHH